MTHLILVRHSLPTVVPGADAADWRLSDEGRARAVTLAEQLADYGPSQIASSDESKARETAEIIAERLGGVLVVSEPGLREHDRRGAPYFGDERAFQATMARFFTAPEELIYGRETAAQARARFAAAVSRIIAQSLVDRDIMVVTHGTVMALYLASISDTGSDAYAIWREQTLPCYAALALPEMRLAARSRP
ncbi:MAG TPA: histidine phosphatase family protein [Ktedonobacterales bacterium]